MTEGRTVIKNLFAEPWKVPYCDLRISTKATESIGMACSTDFIAVPWDVGGGGMLGVLKLANVGRKQDVIRIKGHTGQIHDINFSPFYSSLLASASDDYTVRIWDVPQDPPENHELKDPVAILNGHKKKAAFCEWNPAADFILASAGADQRIMIWNLETKSSTSTIDLPGVSLSLKWNFNGSLLATACKDRVLRIVDPRRKGVASEVLCHDGLKSMKCTWLEGPDESSGHLMTCGFSKANDRQARIWDARNLSTPMSSLDIDRSSQPLHPVFDNSLGMVFIAGKGDGNCRFYQYIGGKLNKVDDYRSDVPMKSFCFAPKRALDVMKCEIGRYLKNEGGKTILPVSLIVPRKNMDTFQADIFPPAPVAEPAVSAADWLGGKTVNPKIGVVSPDGMCGLQKKRTVPITRMRTAIQTTPAVLMQKVDEAEDINLQIQEDKNRLEDEKDRLEDEKDRLQEEKIRYQKHAEVLQKEVDESKTLKDELTKCKSEIEEAHAHIDQLQEEVKSLSDENRTLKLRVKQSDSAKATSSVSDEKYNDVLKKMQPMQEELNEMRSFFVELSRGISA